MPGAAVTWLGQREHVDRVAGHDRDALLAAAAGVAHRVRIRVVRERGAPKLGSRARVERPETPIARGADEHEAARGDAWARAAGAADELLALGQLLVQTEHALP